jgi:hypothetical protein
MPSHRAGSGYNTYIPMQRSNRFTLEHLLYGLALLLGLCLRLWEAGAKPLSDGEAALALQALAIARGESVALGANLAYVVPTGVLFFLTQASNFTARFWPALMGSLLTIAPRFFHRRLGRKVALLMAFGLALDPGLVALSRQAASPIITLALVVFTVAFVYNRRWILSGVTLALAFMSGASLLHGMLMLLFAGLFTFWMQSRRGQDRQTFAGGFTFLKRVDWRLLGVSALLTFLLGGTLFFRYPQAMAAWLASFPEYLQSWRAPSGVPALRLPLTLLVYHPLALLFAVVAVITMWADAVNPTSRRHGLVRFFTVWFVLAMLISMLRPERQISDLAWALLPLWGLAALALERYVFLSTTAGWIQRGLALAVLILMAVFWVQLAGWGHVLAVGGVNYTYLAAMAAVFSLQALLVWMVVAGWSWQVARTGWLWGVGLALLLFQISTLWGLVDLTPQYREVARQELWFEYPEIPQADLLSSTLHDLSNWNSGVSTGLDVFVTLDAPSIRWVLRDFNTVTFLEPHQTLASIEIPGKPIPSFIVTHQSQETLNLAAVYRGQDFAWWRSPNWSGALPPNFLSWLLFRQGPWVDEHIILWARGDMFKGGSIIPPDQVEENLVPGLEIDPLLEKPAQ